MDLFNKDSFEAIDHESVESLKIALKLENSEWNNLLNDQPEVNMRWVQAFELILHENLLNYQYWIRYITYVDKFLLNDGSFGSEYVNSKVQLGLQTTKYDVKNAQKFLYFCHKYWTERGFTTELKQAYEAQLDVPLLDLDNALSKYSTLLSQYFPDEYEISMSNISKVKAKLSRLLDNIITWEDKIDLKGDHDAQVWKEYISWLSKTKNIDKITRNGLLKTTFERSIEHSNFMEDQWVEIWKRCIPFKFNMSADLFCKRLVEKYALDSPFANALYLKYIDFDKGSGEKKSNGLPEWLKENVFKLMKNCDSYDAFYELSSAFLTATLRFLKNGTSAPLTNDHISSNTINDIYSIFEEALKFNNVFHTVEKFCIEIFCYAGMEDNAKELLKHFLNDANCRCQVDSFIFARSVIEKFPNPNFHEYALIGLSHWQDLDWPERLYEEWTRDSYLYGNGNSDTIARKEWKKNQSYYSSNTEEEVDELDKQNDEEHGQEGQKNEESAIEPTIGKRKADDVLASEPKRQFLLRDRENLSVRVYNLPGNVELSEFKELFKTENIRSVTQRENIATIEFSTDEEVQNALTLSGLSFKEKTIEVQKANETTIWVTNYPPEYTQSDLHDLFSKSDLKIMSIRLPSLRNNANRRFCYIEYVDNAMAHEAVRLFDAREIQDSKNKTYKLIVKMSTTTAKNAVTEDNEGKEVFVNKLNFYKVNEEKLREAFSKYGNIKSVKLPLSSSGREANRLNDGYGFIIFSSQEEAHNSLEMNGKNIYGHPVGVSIAEKRGNKNKKVSVVHNGRKHDRDISKSSIKDKTITVMNLDDTINSAQLTNIFEEVGPVYKTVLIPEKNSALVEFEEISDAGKCGMIMNGKIVGKSAISIVPGFALNASTHVSKQDGKRRAQRKEEIQHQSKPSETEVDAMEVDTEVNEESKTGVAPEPAVKSNDYFRNLMLNKK